MSAQTDTRSDARKLKDEELAGEPHLPPPSLPQDSRPQPMEEHLRRKVRHPVAVAGIVEHGLVRPLDPNIKLTERSRVIIVAADAI